MVKKKKISIDLSDMDFSNSVFNNISEAIIIVNSDGDIAKVNKTVRVMFGYTAKELIGARIENIVNMPDAKVHRKNCGHFFKESRKRQMGAGLNISARRKDGSVFPVEVGLSSFTMKDEKFVVAIVSDISKRKKLETDLIKSRKKYKAVFDKANDYFVLIDTNGIIVELNKRVVTEIGYSREEIVGKKLHELPFLPPHEIQKVQRHFKKRLLGKSVGPYEINFIKRNGELLKGEINASIIDFEGSKVDFVVIRDITESRKLADEIRKSRDYFINLMNSTMDLIIAVDKKRNIVLFNKAAENAFGYSQEEIIGKHVKMLYAINPQSLLINNQLKKKSKFSGEIRNKRKNGEIFYSYLSANSIYDDNKNIIGYLGVSRDITKSKQASELLRESEERLRSILESTSNMIMRVDRKGIIKYINFIFSGLTIKEVIGKPIYEFMSPEFRKKAKLSLKKVFDTGKNDSFECSGVGAENSLRWYKINIGPIKEQGKVVSSTVIAVDITELKMSEQEKEELLFDFQGRVKELNCLYGLAKIANHPDLPLEDIVDNVLYLLPFTWQYPEITCAKINLYDIERKTPNYKETIWKLSADISLQNEKIGKIEIFYTQKRPNLFEGPFLEEERNLLDTVAVQVGKIVYSSQLESERKKLLNGLTDKTSELNTILDSIGDAIMTTDENYMVTSVNRAFCDMFDCTAQEYIGKPCNELFKCDGEPKTETCKDHCGLQKTLDNMDTISSRSTITIEEDKTIVIQSINSPLLNSEGRVTGAVKSMRDISKEAEVERMKNEFVATVSHELRTPLTSIKGYIDLFLDGDTGEINEIQNEFLDIVSQNTDRLTALINDLLDIEKIDAGKISFNKKNIILGEIVELAFRTMQPMANESNLEYKISVKDNMEIYADQDRIMQVLTNLLSNAIKFTKKGSVSINLKKVGNMAVLVVKDTGIGVSKADLKKLFTKFYRAKESYKQSVGGTGLGLSIVKSIVELHGGEVVIESTLHKGSEVIVKFPLVAKKGKKVV